MRCRSCIYRHFMRSAYPKSSALLLLQLAVRKQCKMHTSARCLQEIVHALKGNNSKVLLRQPFLYLLAGDANPLKLQTKNALQNDNNVIVMITKICSLCHSTSKLMGCPVLCLAAVCYFHNLRMSTVVVIIIIPLQPAPS